MPSAAAVVLRVAQLTVLVAIGLVAPPPERAALIASFGVISAVAVLSDSGAATYLLRSAKDALTAQAVTRVLGIHTATSTLGFLVALGYCLTSFSDIRGTAVGVVACLGLAQVLDSMVRVIRTPALVFGADHSFAAFDLGLALAKVPWVSAALATGDIRWLLGLPVLSAALVALTYRRSQLALPSGPSAAPRPRHVLAFGINGAASALYSQSPLLIAAASMPIASVATLTICYRVLQPLELLPATISQQVVPRARTGTVRPLAAFAAFVTLGAVVAVCAVLALPVVETVFSTTITPEVIFVVLALSVPIKFGNYALAAFTFAYGLLARKLQATLGVGLLAVGGATVAVVRDSATGVAAVTLASEVALAACLAAIVVLEGRKRA